MEPVQSKSGPIREELGGETPGTASSAPQHGAQPRSLLRKPSALTIASVVFWSASLVVAMVLIANHANAPGRSGAIPQHWPVQKFIELDANRPTLIMFAHPNCPCTRASLGELDALMARCRGQFSAHVVFVKPPGLAGNETESDLWRQASAIPGVKVHRESSQNEAKCFHPETSGQTVLYDRDGRLLFRGGITLSRGHSGDNPGRSALIALLNHQLADEIETPVFGCSLFDESTPEEITR